MNKSNAEDPHKAEKKQAETSSHSPLIPLVDTPSLQRRKEQSPLEITQRLGRLGWTEILLCLKLLISETRAGRLSTQAQYSHGQRTFGITATLGDDQCPIVIEQPPKSRTLTAVDILAEKRKKDLETVMDLRKKLMAITLSFFRNLLGKALKRAMKDKTLQTVLSLQLDFDVLSGKFTYRLEYTSDPSPVCQFSSKTEGSYTLIAFRSEENENDPSDPILENLGETIIRGVDPLYTIIGLDPWKTIEKTIQKS